MDLKVDLLHKFSGFSEFTNFFTVLHLHAKLAAMQLRSILRRRLPLYVTSIGNRQPCSVWTEAWNSLVIIIKKLSQ